MAAHILLIFITFTVSVHTQLSKPCEWVQYLEHDIDLFSQGVGVHQGQLEGNCVGVEEGAGLHKQTDNVV